MPQPPTCNRLRKLSRIALLVPWFMNGCDPAPQPADAASFEDSSEPAWDSGEPELDSAAGDAASEAMDAADGEDGDVPGDAAMSPMDGGSDVDAADGNGLDAGQEQDAMSDAALARDGAFPDGFTTCEGEALEGIAPGVGPGRACVDDIPTITEPGTYSFSFGTESPAYDLPCATNLPDQRVVVYGLRLAQRRWIRFSLSGSSFGAALSITQDCTNFDVCKQTQGVVYEQRALDAGLHYIVMQTTGEATASLKIEFLEYAFSTATSCEEADEQDASCLIVPSTYVGVAPPATSATIPLPTCGDQQRLARNAIKLSITTPTQLTAFIDSTLAADLATSLRSDCGDRGSEIVCIHDHDVLSRALQPGIYYLVSTGGLNFGLDPIGAVQPGNVSCETATALESAALVDYQPRVLGGPESPFRAGWKARYYTFHGGGFLDIRAEAPGHVMIHLLWECGNLSTVVASGAYSGIGSGAYAGITTPDPFPVRDYTVVVSVPEGTRYRLQHAN